MKKQKPKILCVIPSRLHSTRLPKKALSMINNKPMIQWVFESALKCDAFDKVIVATDSDEIANVILNKGGEAQLTPESLQTGSDRVAHVAKMYPQYEVIVNFQGDGPFVQPQMLVTLIQPYLNHEMVPMTTLACPLNYETDFNNPNCVKVVLNKQSNAIYFSRCALPYYRNKIENAPVYLHLGLYAFTQEFLLQYTQMEQTPLEKAESLEQLRVIENGIPLRVCLTQHRMIDINTPEELEQARKLVE